MNPDPAPNARRTGGTMNTSTITSMLVLASMIAVTNPVASAAFEDFDDDAFARLRDRPAMVPTFAASPLESDDAFWIETGTDVRVGLFGEHLEPKDDRFRVGSRTTLGLATTAAPFGRPADLFGVSATLDDVRGWTPLEARGPAGSPGITAFYGWRLDSDIVVQPALSWQDGGRGAPDRVTALLGVRVEF